ncbi:MAG: hypothetical protein AAGA48_27645 [Myxococcota bacterium]
MDLRNRLRSLNHLKMLTRTPSVRREDTRRGKVVPIQEILAAHGIDRSKGRQWRQKGNHPALRWRKQIPAMGRSERNAYERSVRRELFGAKNPGGRGYRVPPKRPGIRFKADPRFALAGLGLVAGAEALRRLRNRRRNRNGNDGDGNDDSRVGWALGLGGLAGSYVGAAIQRHLNKPGHPKRKPMPGYVAGRRRGDIERPPGVSPRQMGAIIGGAGGIPLLNLPGAAIGSAIGGAAAGPKWRAFYKARKAERTARRRGDEPTALQGGVGPSPAGLPKPDDDHEDSPGAIAQGAGAVGLTMLLTQLFRKRRAKQQASKAPTVRLDPHTLRALETAARKHQGFAGSVENREWAQARSGL